jgi:hypothetical protein
MGEEAAVADEDLQLLGVQLAKGHEGVVAGIAAAEDRDSQGAGALHDADEAVEVPLHPADVHGLGLTWP